MQEDWILLIAFERGSDKAYCIVIGLTADERTNMMRLLPEMKLNHCLAVPVALINMMTKKDSDEVKRHGGALFQIEVQTRMHIYDQVPADASDELVDARNDQDKLDEITTKLNGILSRLSFHKMRLESSRTSLDRLCQWEEDFSSGDRKEGSSPKVVIERIQRYISSILHELDFNLRIAQSQLEVVRPSSAPVTKLGAKER